MKKILFFIINLVALSILFFDVNVFTASADFQSGLNNSAMGIGYVTADYPSGILYSQIGKVLNISTTFLGVIFLLLMIYAGYLWMMARGNEQEVEKAKNIIIYAVIGLVVVLAAYAATNLIYIIWFPV